MTDEWTTVTRRVWGPDYCMQAIMEAIMVGKLENEACYCARQCGVIWDV